MNSCPGSTRSTGSGGDSGISKVPPHCPGPPREHTHAHTHTRARGLLLAGREQALCSLPQAWRPSLRRPCTPCESRVPQCPGHPADSPPLAGPGCPRAGAPKPSSFSMPAISLSCWARKAAAGSSSAASGAPLSDDEKKPKSSAIFPASLLGRPLGARLCSARARRCARRPRHCHPRAQEADLGRDGLGAAGPHFLPTTGPARCHRGAGGVRAGGAGTGMR